MLLGEIEVPDGTSALLLDMDGVLFDTLSMDFEVVGRLLRKHVGDVAVSVEDIRRFFPHPLPRFWQLIGEAAGATLTEEQIAQLVADHDEERRTTVPVTLDGVPALVKGARSAGLRVVVVSNNPQDEVRHMLKSGGLLDHVDEVVGNDEPGVASKPAPDMYLAAARRAGQDPAACVAVEDSVLGLQAAHTAGCWTIGVATGADTFRALAESGFANRAYQRLVAPRVTLGRLGITNKTLHTPNDFVSHMVEHIAWRLGCSIDMEWTNDDWRALGAALGAEIAAMPRLRDTSAALGMIDDGSAEVTIRVAADGGRVRLASAEEVDLDWFLSVRCEQLTHGTPLVELLESFAATIGIDIDVTVGSFEDPHHTWEGVYRAVGIALDRMYNATPDAVELPETTGSGVAPAAPVSAVEAGWTTDAVSPTAVRVSRATAESVVSVDLALGTPQTDVAIQVNGSVSVDGLTGLLEDFAAAAGLRLTVRFEATRLSSSHVITEDVGMVIGRALRAMAIARMGALGIYGAGSNVHDVDDVEQGVRVGLSMEGRKFWKYVPMRGTYAAFRRGFLIGHTVSGDLFSEDLDDFIDGFAGGMQASVMVHVGEGVDPAAGWPRVFAGLGRAVEELLSHNPYRKALAPGVKATLA
ncbi:HAD-IA family hydrolase [Actinoplanes sp. HUAS TT8]|uniref:HAD-IA family hydrolase n=1 Tax=Actinoplanes sp. HUAS TT8 TaxID=3447453 RepID=UPI003F51DB98